MIGRRCTIDSLFKLASTCTKLKSHFYGQYNLEKCITIVKQRDWATGIVLFIGATELGHRKLVHYFMHKSLCQVINQIQVMGVALKKGKAVSERNRRLKHRWRRKRENSESKE